MTPTITTERHGGVVTISIRRPPLHTPDRGPIVTGLKERALRAGQNQPIAEALEESERIYRQELCRTEVLQEGLSAFLAKRPPIWKHR